MAAVAVDNNFEEAHRGSSKDSVMDYENGQSQKLIMDCIEPSSNADVGAQTAHKVTLASQPIEDDQVTPKEAIAIDHKTKGTLAPVIFVDPVGIKWSFPYDACKTWDGVKALIKRVFVDCYLPEWYSEQLEDSSDTNNTFSIIKLKPDETRVLVNFWEQLVQPGWEVTIEFIGRSGILEDIYDKKVEERPSTPTTEKAAEVEPVLDVSYALELYQQDGSSMPDFLREVTYEKAPNYQAQYNQTKASSILQEVRRVFLGVSKRSRSDEDFEDIDSEDILGGCTLRVNSTILLNAIKSVIKFQNIEEELEEKFRVYGETNNLDRGLFAYPFRDLYHHKDELLQYRDKTDGPKARHSEEYNRECNRHIDVLIQYLYGQTSIRLREVEAMWSRKIPVTTFSSLWLLLKPGSTVYVPERGAINAYIIESVRGGPQGIGSIAKVQPYAIHVWNLDFDGKILRRSQKKITIPVFDCEREIRSLRLYPERFHENKEGEKPQKEKLIERGKKFLNVVKTPTFQEYTGSSQFHGARKFDNARFIVDHTSQPWEYEISREQPNLHVPGMQQDIELGARTRIPACQCIACEYSASDSPIYQRLAFDDYDDIDLEVTNTLTDEQYMLCWSHVYGYALHDRLWDLIEMEGLKDPRIDKNVIDTLVMRPENNKAMVKAICETYSQKEEREHLFFADFVRGKGEGQVMLLHGPPGTGKTLTVESVAEYTQRPLLSITAADLGHEPDVLEQNLLRFFRNATKWDAIVLLDEADVYLERRSANDLRRNSIVSVFLRALDYFQGILFLTTNRVGSFDEAFMSRIHLQIGYEPLDDAARLTIWNNSFKKLIANHRQGGREIKYSITAKEYVKTSKSLQSLKWNGREIRNAFQTAVALASFEAKQNGEDVPTVTEDHISQVVDMSSTFKQYIKSALQANDSDIAYRERLRNDRFKLVPVGEDRF